MIIKTNIFNRRLSIASFFSLNLNFVFTMTINTLRVLLINYIKIINIANLSKTSSSSYLDLFKLSCHLIDNLFFSKKMRSIRIKTSNQALRTRDQKQAKKDSSIIMAMANSRIVILLAIDLYEHMSSRNTRRIKKSTRLRKSFTITSTITIIIMSRKIFNTINHITSSLTRHLDFSFR